MLWGDNQGALPLAGAEIKQRRLLYLEADPEWLLVANKQLEGRLWRERQRALPADQRGLLQPRYISLCDITHSDSFFAATGVTTAQLGQFAAAQAANPILEWAQAAARQELQRLGAAVPPRLAKRSHWLQRRARPLQAAAS